MSFPVRPNLTDPQWSAWLARFPNLPLPNEYALRWTLGLIRSARASLPPAALHFSPAEQKVLHEWVCDYKDQFARDQRQPPDGFDVGGLLGVMSGIAGLAALGFSPLVGAGLAVACGLEFARKEYRRRVHDQRKSLADSIEIELGAIERVLR